MPIISSVPLGVAVVVVITFGAALHGIRFLVPKAAESSGFPDGSVFRPGIRRQVLLATVFTLSLAACTCGAWIPQTFVAHEAALQTYWLAFLVCQATSMVVGGFVLRHLFRRESGPQLRFPSAFAGSILIHVEMDVIAFIAGIVFTLEIH